MPRSVSLKKNDVVEVWWEDHYCRQGWHQSLEYKPYVVHSVGYFQYKNLKVFVMSESLSEESADNSLFLRPKDIVKIRKLK